MPHDEILNRLGIVPWKCTISPELAQRALDTSVREDAEHSGPLNDAVDRFLQEVRTPEERACLYLQQGKWTEGWALYEHRHSKKKWQRALNQLEEWDGKPLFGDCECQAMRVHSTALCQRCQGKRMVQKSMLVIGELGVREQLFFSRYLPEIIGRNPGHVMLYTRPDLARFFERFSVPLLTSNAELQALINSTACPDFWVSLPSLPHKLGSTAPLTPAFSNKSIAAEAVLASVRSLRIGLAWNPDQKACDPLFACSASDHPTSAGLSPADLQSLISCNHHFYSLQSEWNPQYGEVIDLRSCCHDAADLSAAMENLDLIIAVDNIIVHLAGTLNKTVWLLSEDNEEWYWQPDWYPSVRVFRGPFKEKVCSVVEQVRTELLRAVQEPQVSSGASHQVLDRPIQDTLITRECRYGPLSFYSTDHYVGHSLELYGEYSEGEASLFRQIVRKGDVVIEAGSNIGALTLPLSLLVGDKGEVNAFEPQKDIFEILKANLHACGNVRLWNCALASHPSSIHYAAPRRDKVCNPGNCEILTGEEFHLGALGRAHTLNELFQDGPVALIKIDVEGMELDVLKGGDQLLVRCRPLLYVEDDRKDKSRDLRSWLIERGYRIYRHTPPIYNSRNWRDYHVNVFGDTMSMNLLCVPEERFDLGYVTKQLVRVEE